MGNILKRILLLWILSMAILHVSAYDFEEGGIYYNILPDGVSVEVTYDANNPYNEFGDQPDFVIPQEVEYKGKKYTVTAIGIYAFYLSKTKVWESLDLPITIKRIGDPAFGPNAYAKKVYIHDLTAWCNMESNGGFLIGDQDNASILYLNGKPIKDLSSLDKKCTQIPDYAFYGQRFLEDVTLPDSVKYVGRKAFMGCRNLKRISIGNKVETLSESTFDGCKNLKTIIFRDGESRINLDYSLFREFSIDNVYIGRPISCNGKYSSSDPFCNASLTNVILNTTKDISLLFGVKYGGPKEIQNIFIGPKGGFLYFGRDIWAKKIFCMANIKSLSSVHPSDSLYVLDKDNIPEGMENYKHIAKNLIDIQGFDLKNGAEFEYGDTPDITTSALVNHVPDMKAEMNIGKCFGAGDHTEGLPITLSNDIWTAEIYYPWTYTVTKAPLTVIADNVELPYGSEKKDFTVSYFGFKNGEDESVLKKPVTISTTAKTDSPVGTYPIIPFGGYADNYTLSYERGVLTVVKAEQTIAWTADMPDEATVGTKIKLEATASSGLPVSFKSSDNGIASISVVNGEYYLNCKKAGDVDITACQAGNKNYESATDEVRSLTIVASTGIDDVENTADTAERIYDTNGNVIKKLQRGVNIIRRSDGTVRKVVVR